MPYSESIWQNSMPDLMRKGDDVMRRLIFLTTHSLIICLLLCSCGKINGYNKKDLVPINERAGTDNIKVYCVDCNEGKDITVKIKNLTDDVFGFGEYYTIQVFVDGVWYYVPYVNENMVHDLGHELSPGASDTLTYSLFPYGGKLYPGHYRIACCGIGDNLNNYYAEFDVTDDGRFAWEETEPDGE